MPTLQAGADGAADAVFRDTELINSIPPIFMPHISYTQYVKQ